MPYYICTSFSFLYEKETLFMETKAVFITSGDGFIYLFVVFYVAFNSQGHIATGSLHEEETSAYCTVNHRASVSNYQLSNMKRPAQDSNRQPQRLEARTLTATPHPVMEGKTAKEYAKLSIVNRH